MLLLDEPTSAMDFSTEAQITARMNASCRTRQLCW